MEWVYYFNPVMVLCSYANSYMKVSFPVIHLDQLGISMVSNKNMHFLNVIDGGIK